MTTAQTHSSEIHGRSQQNPETSEISVVKRDGVTTEQFDRTKIERAIERCFSEVDEDVTDSDISHLANWAARIAIGYAVENEGRIGIETIQDIVEIRLMAAGYPKAARHYITYRDERAKQREKRKHPDPRAISDYIHPAKYARYLPDKKRRETYEETIERCEKMHLRQNPVINDLLHAAFNDVRDKRVLPSMRSMQFGGAAIEKCNARMYNCWATVIDRPEVFGEILWILLCGGGVGYSIQWQHVNCLPSLSFIDDHQVVHHVIEDSIEGWGDALKALIDSYINGYYIEFSYHKIRHEGEPLKTSGGKAPGHIPLKRALERIRAVLDNAQGRKLRPIECHDILCHGADAVLAGGIRRSAMLALFSPDDSEMMLCKTGDWINTAPQRGRANNSVALDPNKVEYEQYKRIFDWTRQYGEPGFYWTEDPDYVPNPCCEIGMKPRLYVSDENTRKKIEAWAEQKGRDMPPVQVGDVYSGFQACNLVEVNAAQAEDEDAFLKQCRSASVIATSQASFTELDYLGWISEAIVDREALIGVSIMGVMDNPSVALDEGTLRTGANVVRNTNAEVARQIGINRAARTTCVKPGGKAPMEVGGVASGVIPHHARRYFRRIIANKNEPPYQHFKKCNPHMTKAIDDRNDVITFPVEVAPDAKLKEDFTATEFFDVILRVKRAWVDTGTADSTICPGLTHNVSNTITVEDDEWDAIADAIWEHRHEVRGGLTLMPSVGDKIYPNAPYEEVRTDADEAEFRRLVENYTPVDWTEAIEEEDQTDLVGEVACSGGQCEI